MSLYDAALAQLEVTSISGLDVSYSRVRAAKYWLQELQRLDSKTDESVLEFLLKELCSYSNEYVAR